MKKIFCAIVLFISCITFKAYSQSANTVLTNAVSALKILSNEHIIEKAYMHFDKPYYASGDTIYFKAYVTLGEHHDLSKASGILYVDLINQNNAIVNSIKLQLTNGVSWGDFALPDTLQKGNYRVRAYTKYMENDPRYFFDKVIPIGSVLNNVVTESSSASAQTSKNDLQFFPEGGELATGLLSKVAFKAIGTNGLGVNVKGVVLDNTNVEVANFVSSHLGMGIFEMDPEVGKTYKAKVTFADGTQGTFDLPAIMPKAIVVTAQDTLDKISVEIRSNKAYFAENQGKEINMVVYSGGLVSSVNAKLDSRRLDIDIPNNQFGSGIVQITLFSATGEPLSERLVFLKNKDLLNLAVSSNKTSYSKRENVQVSVNAKNKDAAGTEGHFSVSVIDESKVPVNENNETTILTYLLLTDDLHGYVEQPNYYFANNTRQTNADLDMLMLTQGYRRFSWKELLSGNNTKFALAPERTLDITGHAKTASGTPVVGKDLMLTAAIGGNMLGDKTDADGNFKFGNMIYQENTVFTLQATGSTKNKATTLLTVDKDKPGPAVTAINIPGMLDDVNRQMVAYLYNSQQQQDELYRLGLKRPVLAQTLAPGETGHPDQVVNGSELGSSPSLVTALTGKLNGIDFVQGMPYVKALAKKGPMLIVVNGKIRGSYVNINNISPADVQSVEVLKGASADAYGIYGVAGVLSINTRKDAKVDIDQPNGNIKFNAVTMAPPKTVTVKDNKNYRSSSLGGSGHADQVIKGDDIRNSPSLSDALSGRLRGIDIVNGQAFVRGNVGVSGGGMVSNAMLLVVDGSPVRSTLDSYNPNDIETIEVLTAANASIYGIEGGSGVLVLTTRQLGASSPDGGGATSALGTLQFTPKGFYKAREFYSPKYVHADNTKTPDLRSTIFWKPEVVTDKDGNASFDFYNADGKGTYRLVIEGIDNAGNVGRQVYTYKVE